MNGRISRAIRRAKKGQATDADKALLQRRLDHSKNVAALAPKPIKQRVRRGRSAPLSECALAAIKPSKGRPLIVIKPIRQMLETAHKERIAEVLTLGHLPKCLLDFNCMAGTFRSLG